MTTPESIADLIDGNTDLLQAYLDDKAARDAEVLGYGQSITGLIGDVAAASTLTLSVDAVLGDDVALGTEETPLKTIEAALARVPSGGRLKIKLLSDYVIDRLIQLEGGTLYIVGDGAQRQITFAEVDPDNPAAERSPGFMPRDGGSINYLRFQSIDLVGAQNPTPAAVVLPAFFQVNSPMFVRMLGCEIILPPGSDQWIFAANGFVSFNITTTVIPSDIAGRWVQGVTSGTDPLTLPMVQTNLVTL